MEIDFNSIPKALEQLLHKVENLERLFLTFDKPKNEIDQWFNIDEFRNYVPDKPSKATVYAWAHDSLVPHYKKGKKLFFLKSEIDLWLKEGRKKTLSEISKDADAHLTKKGGRNGK